jgi:cysteinyl-tRNA synthetase
LDECAGRLREVAAGTEAPAEPGILARFTEVLDDDLNVSAAWGAIFEWVRERNRAMAEGRLTPVEAGAALAAWRTLAETLGLWVESTAEAPEEVRALAEERQAARKARDFKRSDVIRDQLKALGWIVEDTPKGPKLKRL